MKLTEEIKVVFKNPKGLKAHIVITVKQLLDMTSDDLYEVLDNTAPCTSSSCYNESNNFCDCGSVYEDYEIFEILLNN